MKQKSLKIQSINHQFIAKNITNTNFTQILSFEEVRFSDLNKICHTLASESQRSSVQNSKAQKRYVDQILESASTKQIIGAPASDCNRFFI